ncbi:hypothetical protein [Sciscionella marina]|uniref:hypothetical protein n=1 Tax=Sciscionella marina TaxID=508770 RepID=UPI0003675DB9|nr:hypothetical protein [Sciscionella marina]
MNSHTAQHDVLAELGDKVQAAVAQSVAAARADLSEYRELRPAWVAEHSEGGLANWIHDRVWSHLMHQLDGEPDVTVVDQEPTRSFRIGTRYLVRVKRHGPGDKISTYPTQTALQFYLQGVQTRFPGMDEIRLVAGYLWDPETRAVGDAVISMRDGLDNVVWSVVVDVDPGSGAVGIRPVPTEPTPPTLEFPDAGRVGEEE